MENLLRRDEVLKRVGISETTLYRWMKEGRFPQPVQLGPRAVAWPESDLREWQEGRPRAGSGG